MPLGSRGRRRLEASSRVKTLPKNIARYLVQDLQLAEVPEVCSRQYYMRSASDVNAEKQLREQGDVSLAGVPKSECV